MFLGKLVRVRIAEVLPIKKILATPIQKILPLPRTWKGKDFCFLVGVVGFEPTTPYTPCRCPAGLGHTPTLQRV
jgi:hypothetical protein